MSLDKANPKFAVRPSLRGVAGQKANHAANHIVGQAASSAAASQPDLFSEDSTCYVPHMTVLEEFRMNVKRLEQLQSRLSFMMSEVRELVKK